MRKSHKKALGLLGLATVVGMTTVAANLPTPAGAVSSSVTDVISVTVVDNTTPVVSITNIADGTIFTDPKVNISINHTNLKDLTLKLKWGNTGSSNIVTLLDKSFTLSERTGIEQLTINLDDYGGYNTYSLFADGNGYNGGLAVPSTVNFRYTGASIEGVGTETDSEGNIIGSDIPVNETTGDPVINIETSDDVDKVIIQVVDKDGNVVLEVESTGDDKDSITLPFEEHKLESGEYKVIITGQDKDGNPVGEATTIIYDYQANQDGDTTIVKDTNTYNPVVNVPELEEGHYVTIIVYDKDTGKPVLGPITVKEGGKVELDFTGTGKDGLATGKYTIVLTEYNKDDEVVDVSRLNYNYIPGPPATGSFLGRLNISRADYLTTGAIVFGLALIFAFVFLRKKKGTRRR